MKKYLLPLGFLRSFFSSSVTFKRFRSNRFSHHSEIIKVNTYYSFQMMTKEINWAPSESPTAQIDLVFIEKMGSNSASNCEKLKEGRTKCLFWIVKSKRYLF